MPNQKKEAVVVTPEWFEEGVLGFLMGTYFSPLFFHLFLSFTQERKGVQNRGPMEKKRRANQGRKDYGERVRMFKTKLTDAREINEVISRRKKIHRREEQVGEGGNDRHKIDN
jgi:hypothetical protein